MTSLNNTIGDRSDSWSITLSFFCTILLLFLCLFGVVSNLFSIIVFLHSHFRQLSINILLAALSASDLFLLLLSSAVFASGPFIDYLGPGPFLVAVHAYSAAWLYPIANMFHCTSIWLLLAVTFERWLAVCRPLTVGVYCTRQRAVGLIIVETTVSVLYNAARFWEFKVVPGPLIEPELKDNPHYVLWYSTVSTVALLYAGPLLLHVYFYFNVSRQLLLARHARQQMTDSELADRRTTAMLGCVVLSFICCYSLSLLLNILESINPETFNTSVGELLSDVNNTLVSLNASCSAIFYFKFSSRYRETLKNTLRYCCFKEKNQPAINAVLLDSLKTNTNIIPSRRMITYGSAYYSVIETQRSDSCPGSEKKRPLRKRSSSNPEAMERHLHKYTPMNKIEETTDRKSITLVQVEDSVNMSTANLISVSQ